MNDLRQKVLDELARRGWTRNQLCQEIAHAGIAVGRDSVYRWLNGRGIEADKAMAILEFLGLCRLCP